MELEDLKHRSVSSRGERSLASVAPDVSVAVVNWNTVALTTEAIRSLLERTHDVSYEVILVDNGSDADDSARELPRRFPWVRFIANSANAGFSRASNQAIALASGRYILLLNSDTVQIENAVGRAVRYLDSHPDVGILGIQHRNLDAAHTPQASAFSFPRVGRDVRGLLLGHVAKDRARSEHAGRSSDRDVDWVCGSFLMIRRCCIEDVGLLDERFFSYDEDVDWCRRAWRAGWRVRFWPEVTMLHVGSAAGVLLPDKRLQMFRSRLAYYRKHHTRTGAMCFFLAAAARLGGAAVKQGMRMLVGGASKAEVRDRWRRFQAFCTLL